MLFLKKQKMLQNLERQFKAPKSFKNVSHFHFIFSNNHQCNYTKTIRRLRRRKYRRIVTETIRRLLNTIWLQLVTQ